MPPKKGSKKAKAPPKGKGKKRQVEEDVVETQQEAMAVDSPSKEDVPETPVSASISIPVPDSARVDESSDIPQSVPEVIAAAASTSSTVAEAVTESISETVSKAAEKVVDVVHAAEEFVEDMTGTGTETRGGGEGTMDVDDQPSGSTSQPQASSSMTPEQRRSKMDELRKRMRESAALNRSAVIHESTTHVLTHRETARLERQKKLAENLRSKAQAADEGKEEEWEREKNWEYTVEDNDNWEKKMKRKRGRADFQYHDDEDRARRKYKKDLDLLKPDLVAYNRQKEQALGLAPGTLVKTVKPSEDAEAEAGGSGAGAGAGEVVVAGASTVAQRLANENLYRDANSLIYADNKPSEDVIDKLVEKLNKDQEKRNKFSRKRANKDDELINYINEKNRVFNRKIARFYDKYTEEIRASFERGTAI